MIAYPHIDPVFFRVGPLTVRWYGLMYAVGFVASYILVQYQIKKQRLDRDQGMSEFFVDTLFTLMILALLIGARLGYVLFYDLGRYLRHPSEIFAVWHGGMSFHGGLIGALLAAYLVCRKFTVDYWLLADLVIVTAPIGLAAGRIGNFINGELWGRVTDVPWAMIFPSGGPLPRHPSQLYECLLEGVVLFAILWIAKDRKHFPGALTGLFIVLYGCFRFFIEFFREPDAQLGFVAGPFTMGQVLCACMIVFGAGLLWYLRKRSIRPA